MLFSVDLSIIRPEKYTVKRQLLKSPYDIFQEKELSDVISLKCGHRCRADPVEATIYCLEAEGEDLKKFRADAAAELTVEVEEQDKKTYDMEVTLNVLREDVVRVRLEIHLSLI